MRDPNAKSTPVTADNAEALLTFALTEALQNVPPQLVGIYLLALVWIETAQGKSIIGNNPGNLMAAGFSNGKEIISWPGNAWRPDWFYNESDPTHARMLAGQAPSAFRAYATPQAGFNDYAALLVKPAKRAFLDAAMADDPLAFVRALRKTYSPDYTDKHAETIRQFRVQFATRFAPFAGVQLPWQSSGNIAQAKSKSAKGIGAAGVILGLLPLIFIATLTIKSGKGR